MATSSELRVSMAHSSLLIQIADTHPKFAGRAALLSSLIEAYSLHQYLQLIPPQPASERDLTLFHSRDYISYIKSTCSNGDEEDSNLSDQYGLSYDCPLFPGLYSYISSISSATVTMAKQLVTGETDVAINWYGGWHHGKKDEASGFCYCNDIVIGILHLLKCFQRILYIDIDIHHGNGVQDAFYYSSKVLTISFHKHSPGFFPGTGSVDDTGSGSGQYHNINVPLWDGINDEQYTLVFKSVVSLVYKHYNPQVVVFQCGADCLAGDPLGSFNLSLQAIGTCLHEVLRCGLPMLLLGGGGYHFSNTARCWTYLTSIIVGKELLMDIPEHKYFTSYGPDYQLEVELTNRQSESTAKTITELIETISNIISCITLKF